MLKPIKKHIIFKFVDDILGGQFVRKTVSGLVIPGHFDDSAKMPRWATIYAYGPEVDEELKQAGIFILVEALQWTPFFNYQGEKLWRTDETKIIGYCLPEDLDGAAPGTLFVV